MGIARRLGREAQNPHLVASLVAASAVLFTVPWVALSMAGVWPSWSMDAPLVAAVFLLGTPLNAYLVTRVVWVRFVADAPRPTYLRALGAAVLATLVAYYTLSVLYLAVTLGYDLLAGTTTSVLNYDLVTYPFAVLLLSVSGVVVGVFATYGIPIGLTVAIALGITYLGRRTLQTADRA